jgi:hypothetical protein
MSFILKAEGPNGPAKIRSYDSKHGLGLAHYLRSIGYNAWIEDINGNAIDEGALKMAITRLVTRMHPPLDAVRSLASVADRWAPRLCRPSSRV